MADLHPIDAALASFEDTYSGARKRPTIAEVRTAVASTFGVPVNLIQSDKRIQPAARARQVTMLLAHEMTGRSISAIARACHRDHTTVLYAISAVRKLAADDYELACQIAQARALVASIIAGRPPVDGAAA